MRRFNRTCVSLAVMVAAACDSSEPTAVHSSRFVEVGIESGIDVPTHSGGQFKLHIRESLGQGACWLDYDTDDDPDLLVLNGAVSVKPNYDKDDPELRSWGFYENDAGRFSRVSEMVGLDVPAWGVGCAVGDINADGFDDLYITTAAGPNLLFVNLAADSGRRFVDSTQKADVGMQELSASAAFGDLDGDGDLDLFVTTYLDEAKPPEGECKWKGATVMCGPKSFPMLVDRIFRNDGVGRFTDISNASGIGNLEGFGLGAILLDADTDGDLDIYVANDSSPNRMLVNDGSGQFSDNGFLLGIAYSESGTLQAGMGVDAADLDGDGLTDLVVTNFSDDTNNFYRRLPQGSYAEWSSRSGLASASYRMLGWSVLAEDFDLDSDLDLFVANGHVYPALESSDPGQPYRQRLQLLINDGNGRFSENRDALGGIAPANARGAAAADFDRDGDMDLVVTRDGELPLLLRNDMPGPDTTWLGVRLEGAAANPHAIGARVVINVNGKAQVREIRANRGYLSASEPIAIFGLREATTVDSLEIHWPGGAVTTLQKPDINRMHILQRPRN